jgi:hypothetical protein
MTVARVIQSVGIWGIVCGVMMNMAFSAPTVTTTAAQEAIGACPWNPKEVCITLSTKELAQRATVVWRLRAENERLKAGKRRFGCAAGVGIGVSGVVDSDWNAKIVPAGHAGLTCGVLF